VSYLLHVRQAPGFKGTVAYTMSFPTDADRALVVILLRALPLELRLEDVPVTA